MKTKTRVAVIQAAPVFMNLDACMEKARDLMQDAAKQGAEVAAFPEAWLPGYPAWLDSCRDAALWDHEPTKNLFARLVENSVAVPSSHTEALASLAREFSVVLSIGIHERVKEGPGHGTLYNSNLLFNSDGVLLNCHRKIMPTFSERMIWGMGDGMSLFAADTSAGRVGALICWEHWMPLTRQVLHSSREQVHVAAWPWVKEMNLLASRHYAFEGRCFVLACGGILHARDLPKELEPLEILRSQPDALILKGGSAIIGPDGKILAGPIFEEEAILFADVDFSAITRESLTLDVTGHYARPDLFDLRLRRGKSIGP
ncbi:MAG: carbon-nitrogen hydrolase family protein [Candidatus Acidiferrales bacterium]